MVKSEIRQRPASAPYVYLTYVHFLACEPPTKVKLMFPSFNSSTEGEKNT